MLSSVHAIHRVSLGALVFPAGLLLGVLIGWHHPAAIAYAALVLGAADPAAALVGRRSEGIGWPVIGGHKTLAGSLAFVVVAVAIGLLVGLGAGDLRLMAVLGASLVLVFMESSIGYGLDNISIPAVASLLGISWLGL